MSGQLRLKQASRASLEFSTAKVEKNRFGRPLLARYVPVRLAGFGGYRTQNDADVAADARGRIIVHLPLRVTAEHLCF